MNIARIELDRPRQKLVGFLYPVAITKLPSLQEIVISCPTGRRFGAPPRGAGGGQPAFQSRDDCLHYLVLYCEDIFDGAIVALSPEVLADGCINQLGRYPNFRTGLSNAA